MASLPAKVVLPSLIIGTVDAEVLIIGGGYAGLSAGALLARSGIDVLLLEASSRPGGRAAWEEREGFLLEHGLHDNRFAERGAAAAVFRKLGMELEFLELGETELWDGDSFVPLPAALTSILRSPLLGPRDSAAAARAFLPLALLPPRRLYHRSLEEILGKRPRPRVKRLLSLLSGLGIIAPDLHEASAGEFAAFLQKAMRSPRRAGYPRGGTRAIIEGLRRALEENGEIRTGTRVERIVPRKGRIEEAVSSQGIFRASAVISAVPVQTLPSLLDRRDIPTLFRRMAEEMLPTAGISLEMALSAPVSERRGLLVTDDPFSMGQFTSNIDPSAAPPGKQLISWFQPLPFALMDDGEAVRREEERMRALLRKMFPGIEEKAEWERIMHLRMVDGFLPSPGQSRPRRPGHRVEGLENLFIAGDGTAAMGTGGDAAIYSAMEVSGLVRSYLGA